MTQSTEKELLKMVVKINNKVQEVNQKVILLTEKVDKGFTEVDKKFAKNEEAHEELKRLILSGDEGAVKLIVDEEDEQTALLRRVVTIEKDVKKIKQKVFA